MRFININVGGLDAAKHSALPVLADARVALEALRPALEGHRVDPAWEQRATAEAAAWAAEVQRLVQADPPPGDSRLPSQASIIGAMNDAAGETGVVVCAAGVFSVLLPETRNDREDDGAPATARDVNSAAPPAAPATK